MNSIVGRFGFLTARLLPLTHTLCERFGLNRKKIVILLINGSCISLRCCTRRRWSISVRTVTTLATDEALIGTPGSFCSCLMVKTSNEPYWMCLSEAPIL